MTFAEVLPHLAAGRIAVRQEARQAFDNFQYRWQEVTGLEYSEPIYGKWNKSIAGIKSLLASDWTIVEEPTKGNCDHRSKNGFACAMSQPDGATGGTCCACACHETLEREVARLTRELAEAKRHIVTCMCFHCRRLRHGPDL